MTIYIPPVSPNVDFDLQPAYTALVSPNVTLDLGSTTAGGLSGDGTFSPSGFFMFFG
jgi:hypothetical protein